MREGRRDRRRVGGVVATVVAMAAGVLAAGPATAQVDGGGHPAEPVDVLGLPFEDRVTEFPAALDPADPRACSDGPAVWYRWRATVDGPVEAALDQFHHAVAVYTGEPGALDLVGCDQAREGYWVWEQPRVAFEAELGATYLIAASRERLAWSEYVTVRVRSGVTPPFERPVELAADGAGRVDTATDEVTVGGTVDCEGSIGMGVTLRQDQGGSVVTAGTRAQYLACDRPGSRWTSTLRPGEGSFQGGAATLVVTAENYPFSTPPLTVEVELTAPPVRVHTVDSAGDGEDAGMGDGSCRTAAGVCTLRAAITEAEASTGADRIEFAIPGAEPHVIRPGSPYRPLADQSGPTTVDGYTQPGTDTEPVTPDGPNIPPDLRFTPAPAIEIVGPGATSASTFDLFRIRSADNEVTGLAMHGFHKHVTIEGVDARRNAIVGNVIGVAGAGSDAPSGETEPVSGANGVTIRDGASDNVVGATGITEGNIISGNGQHGIAVYGEGTDRNVLQANVIGVDQDLTRRVPNQGGGVVIASGASDNLVGGEYFAVGEGDRLSGRNIIAGNRRHGVQLLHGAGTTANRVLDNLIGVLYWSDELRVPRNWGWGVRIEDGVVGNVVERNVISNNGLGGVVVGGGAKHNRIVGNGIGRRPRGGDAGNRGPGVRLERGPFGIEVDDNEIEHNGGAGIEAVGGTTNSNAFRGNTFHANGGLAIDLAPLGEENEPLTRPAPTGPNKGIGAPVIDGVSDGAITGRGCGGCVIELYVRRPYGDFPLTTTSVVDGRWLIRTSLLQDSGGHAVLATATDPVGNTSELSDALEVVPG